VKSDTSTKVNPIRDNSIQWDGNTQGLLGIAHGSAGMIFELGEYQVVKVYLGRDSRRTENSETERQAYRNIKYQESRGNSSEHVLRCYDIENPYGLVLERCYQTLRQRIRSSDYSQGEEALHFAFQAAKGLAFIHRCGIRQGDVGCHNMLLDHNGVLKIGDFAGSSVDSCRFASTVDYEVGSKLPGAGEPTERTDIFALGSAMYEMITRITPYQGFSYTEVQRRFKQGKYPNEFGEFCVLGRIIKTCWGQGGRDYDSAEQVLNDIYTLGPPSYVLEPSYSSSDEIPNRSILPDGERSLSASLEAPRTIPRKKYAERTKYVNSHRNEKEIKRTRNSQMRKTAVDHGVERTQRTQKDFNGPMVHLVQMVQALLSGHSRPIPDKRRYHY